MTASSIYTAPSFFLKTVLIQIIAAATSIIIWYEVQLLSVSIVTASVAALASSAFLRLPSAWRLLNAILPCATAATLTIDIPGAFYLFPLLLILMVYAPALITRVPYYPTQRPAYALILAELPTDRSFTFVDIGCGFGDLLFFLAQHRPLGTFIGIELGPLPYAIARLRALVQRHRNAQILCRDMWRFPLGNFDYVYTFLSPAAMGRIWNKASEEMRSGSTFITNSFPAPAEASETLLVRDQKDSKLYIYRF